MIYALVLFVVGVFLSAFFSGSETGFYRATRVRLTMDAISGDNQVRLTDTEGQVRVYDWQSLGSFANLYLPLISR